MTACAAAASSPLTKKPSPRRRPASSIDGRLVPREGKKRGLRVGRKRRREESGAATPPEDTEAALRAERERLIAENRELKRRRRRRLDATA